LINIINVGVIGVVFVVITIDIISVSVRVVIGALYIIVSFIIFVCI
jgi:hypothetical protein